MSHTCEWCRHFGTCRRPGACERIARFEPFGPYWLIAVTLAFAIGLLAFAAFAPAAALIASVLSW